jgi:cupin fold WbuC family metalloprotein
MSEEKRALPAPSTDLAPMTRSALDEVLAQSRLNSRRRMILPFHRGPEDSVHRMLNALQMGSYVRPHRHRSPPKPEAWVVLQGELLFVTFFDDGEIDEALTLSAWGEQFGVDLVPGRYHTLAALKPDTVIYEVKSGPYDVRDDKEFAPWSPEEGSEQADAYLDDLLKRARE